MPKVSILLPTKNRASLISKAIESVQNQSFTDWEMLVIDNGSTDETRQVVERYAKTDPRVAYLSYTEKPGIQNALNYGLKRARGEYVARIDDDDVWLSDKKLETQVEFLDKNEDYLLVGTDALILNEKGERVGEILHPKTDQEIRKAAMRKNPFAHPSVMFRLVSAQQAGGYCEEYEFVQDYDLWLKMLKLGKGANIGQFWLGWRRASSFNPEKEYKKYKIQTTILWRHRFEFSGFIFGFIRSSLKLVGLFLFKNSRRLALEAKRFFSSLKTLDLVLYIFIAAVFSLVWRNGNVHLINLPKPFELLVFFSAGLLLLSLIFSEHDSEPARRFFWAIKPFKPAIGVLLLGFLIGSLNSYFAHPDSRQYFEKIFYEYARIFFSFGLFFLSAFLAIRKGAARPALLAIAASAPILWLARSQNFFELFLAEGRLRGADGDPNYLATFIAFALIISISGWVSWTGRGRVLFLVSMALSAPLFLWTGSRAAWFSFFLAAILLLIFLAFSRQKYFSRALAGLVLVATFFSIGFFFLPHFSKVNIAYRALSSTISPRAFSLVLDWLGENAASRPDSPGGVKILDMELPKKMGFAFGQDRLFLWNTGVDFMKKNLLGLGPVFYLWQPLELIGQRPQGPHNLFLELSISGGVLALLAGLYLYLKIFEIAFVRAREEISFENLALLACFSYFLINSFFLDTFTVRWFWLVMAFIVASPFRYTKENSQTQ